MKNILATFKEARSNNKKLLAILIDPDKFNDENIIDVINTQQVDFVLVGGSLITQGNLELTIQRLKSKCTKPIIIFPSSASHISEKADAIFLLSLISGRNPEYLISQHVQAAPIISKLNIETLSVSYILIDGGNLTSVAYISNTTPIPAEKNELILATALAGELIGHQLIYLEAGSGAKINVSDNSIRLVKSQTNNPIVVGGGIRNAETAKKLWEAGADCLVIGNATENNLTIIEEIAKAR
jgi:putative glycerol-1-phosphate prenyltransferase